MIKNSNRNSLFRAMAVSLVFVVAFFYTPAYGKWDDKSDELPGMTSDNEVKGTIITTIVVGVGLIAAITIPAVIMKKKRMERALPKNTNENTNEKSVSSGVHSEMSKEK
jgi:hypothetical protein